MSDHYAQRNASRQALLTDLKNAVDAENQQKYAEQQKKHDEELKVKRDAAQQILNEEMGKLEVLKAGNAAKLAEIRAAMQSRIDETLKAHGAEGNESVQRAKAKLEDMHRLLEEKQKRFKEELANTTNILEHSEKLRQEEHNKIKAEGVEKKKAMNERLLGLHEKIHSSRMQGQEELKKLDEESHKKQLSQAEKEGDRGFGAVVNTYELQNSVAVEDGFRAFSQMCQNLNQKYITFRTEFNTIEAMLLTCHHRMLASQPIEDCNMEYLFEALTAFQRAIVEFSAAGSTKEKEFTEMIRDLTVMAEDLSTQFNAIQSKTDNYEPKGENAKDAKDTGILEGILEAKKIMKEMSEKVQNFNVIPRDHVRETLAIQMKAAASSRSSSQYAIKNHEEAHEEPLAIEQ